MAAPSYQTRPTVTITQPAAPSQHEASFFPPPPPPSSYQIVEYLPVQTAPQRYQQRPPANPRPRAAFAYPYSTAAGDAHAVRLTGHNSPALTLPHGNSPSLEEMPHAMYEAPTFLTHSHPVNSKEGFRPFKQPLAHHPHSPTGGGGNYASHGNGGVYTIIPNYSPPVAYHRVTHSPPLPEPQDAVVRPLALRHHHSPPQYTTHLMVPHPAHSHYTTGHHQRQIFTSASPTPPISPAPSSPTLSIVPQFASDEEDHHTHGHGHEHQHQHHTHYHHVPHSQSVIHPMSYAPAPGHGLPQSLQMPLSSMHGITHVAVPTMQAQPTAVMQSHATAVIHSQPHYQTAQSFVMIAAPQPAHPQTQTMTSTAAVVSALNVDLPTTGSPSTASTKSKGSKRTATQMREFVRSYFANHAANLVNKDLNSISHELQMAYEREFPAAAGSPSDKADRKPVFCRTFIQKVARSMGFLLTLNYGLVDKRMKHLMKIRKRGKKVKKENSQQLSLGAASEEQSASVPASSASSVADDTAAVAPAPSPEPLGSLIVVAANRAVTKTEPLDAPMSE